MTRISIFLKLFFGAVASYFFCTDNAFSQTYSLKDSLRGALRTERDYNVLHYNLDIKLDPKDKFISGSNEITFISRSALKEIQVDLFENMKINKVTLGKKSLKFRRVFDAVFIECPLSPEENAKIKIDFEGHPLIAKNAPWDGGFVWKNDSEGNPWIGVACEGIGASLWWPNKDHLSDEPETMDIWITVPKDLVAVSNGRLIGTEKSGKKDMKYHWQVGYPINNYNVTLYVGDYVNFKEEFTTTTKEKLVLNYHVLRPNLEKAKEHFKQTQKVLESFEHYHGPYPFIKDGYALVESPYLGMEHQSAIAYGNKFTMGYLGGRIPEEFPVDYIILHESAHEYWGNSVSCKDHAEMWIHEGFATYMENLYIEYLYGKEAALRYLESNKKAIKNDKPLLGPKSINYTDNPGDIYSKGAWVLQSLRYAIGNDSIWFDIFRTFYNQHKYGFAETKDFVYLVNFKTQKDFTPFLRQCLKYKKLPKLVYSVSVRDNYTQIKYKLDCLEREFYVPIEFSLDGKKIKLEPKNEWKYIEFNRIFKEVKPVTKEILLDVEKV